MALKSLAPQAKVEISEEVIKAVMEETGASEELVRRIASIISARPAFLGIPKSIACLRCRFMLPIPIISTIRRVFWCLLCKILPGTPE